MHKSKALKYPFNKYYLHEIVKASSPKKLAILSTPMIDTISILKRPVYKYFKISLIATSENSSK